MSLEINWANPITRGLIGYGTFADGNIIEHVRMERGIISNGGEKIVPRDQVLAGEFPDTTSSAVIDLPKHDNIYVGASEGTWMALARNKSASAPGSNNCPFGHGGTGIDPWRIDWLSSEDVRMQIRNEAADTFSSSVTDGMGNSNGIYNSQNWNLMGGTWSNNSLFARINYHKATSGTATTGVQGVDTDSANRPHIGNASTGATTSWNGWVSMVAVWNRELTDAEWNSMVINPWQPLKSRSVLILLAIATVSGQTLTITLVDSSGTPLSNLTGLNWAWFNESVTSSANAPSDTGTGATTDSSGILQLTLPNTTLTAGQTGMLALMDSSGMIYAWYRVTL